MFEASTPMISFCSPCCFSRTDLEKNIVNGYGSKKLGLQGVYKYGLLFLVEYRAFTIFLPGSQSFAVTLSSFQVILEFSISISSDPFQDHFGFLRCPLALGFHSNICFSNVFSFFLLIKSSKLDLKMLNFFFKTGSVGQGFYNQPSIIH